MWISILSTTTDPPTVCGYNIIFIFDFSVPPLKVSLSHKRRSNEKSRVFDKSDYIQMNCTSVRVKPKPSLRWVINKIEVSKH